MIYKISLLEQKRKHQCVYLSLCAGKWGRSNYTRKVWIIHDALKRNVMISASASVDEVEINRELDELGNSYWSISVVVNSRWKRFAKFATIERKN
jgi:hypothetical protein